MIGALGRGVVGAEFTVVFVYLLSIAEMGTFIISIHISRGIRLVDVLTHVTNCHRCSRSQTNSCVASVSDFFTSFGRRRVISFVRRVEHSGNVSCSTIVSVTMHLSHHSNDFMLVRRRARDRDILSSQ